MPHLKKLPYYALFVVLAMGCTRQSETQVVPSKVSEPQIAMVGEFNESKALSVLYNGYVPEKKHALWIMKEDSTTKDDDGISFAGKEVFTTALQTIRYTEAGKEKLLLLTKTRPADFTCQACSPIIGGSIFIHENNGWSLGPTNKMLTTMGEFGEVRHSGKLSKIGSDKYGILFDLGSCNQGTCFGYQVLFGEAEGKLEKLLWIEETEGKADPELCMSDDGKTVPETCWTFKSEVRYLPVKGKDYYDIEVVTKGKKEGEDQKAVPFQQVRRYMYANGSYQLQQ